MNFSTLLEDCCSQYFQKIDQKDQISADFFCRRNMRIESRKLFDSPATNETIVRLRKRNRIAQFSAGKMAGIS